MVGRVFDVWRKCNATVLPDFGQENSNFMVSFSRIPTAVSGTAGVLDHFLPSTGPGAFSGRKRTAFPLAQE
jgi:hypothetical protein